MISETRSPYEKAFVWVWLPGATKPVVAGVLAKQDDRLQFNYGRSYLALKDAIALYEPELPLKAGLISPLPGLSMASCIRDASPDAWGRRVLINRKYGYQRADTSSFELDELTYLLESGSDRIGALDFQLSATDYVPREKQQASLEELMSAAQIVEQGVPLSPDLDQALLHGTSLGGARPKVLIEDSGRKLIAKFSASNDLYNVVKLEFIAMRLARKAGLDVAPVSLASALGKDVLLIERFDRIKVGDSWSRRGMVSALTMLELDEMMAAYASYEKLAEIIRHRFVNPRETLHELFGRMVFNVLCGNTDDHARNHAAFWDGRQLALTPAYDICPQSRAGQEATQAMLIHGSNRKSQIATCVAAASTFLLSEEEAIRVVNQQVGLIESEWQSVCDEASLSQIDRSAFWRRQFMNPYAFFNAPNGIRLPATL